MKTMKKTIMAKTILLIALISTLGLSSASALSTDAVDIPNQFNFSPARAGIDYIQGSQGLDYVSFNNFINNPNIPSDSRGACLGELSSCEALPGTPGVSKDERRRSGDERLFTLSKYCEGGVCPTGKDNPQNVYYNFLQNPIFEGDKVRFEVYFHNNAKDPFLNRNTESARNVQVGIDLNNIVDTNLENLLKPKGYIYADNNSYPNTNTKTATNDTLMLRYSNDLYLEMVPNTAWLWMYLETDPLENVIREFDGEVHNQTTLSFTTLAETTKNITITPNIDLNRNKMWLHFDELPGCFGYSGFAYFDAVVKKRPTPVMPTCEDMTLNQSPASINGQQGLKLITSHSFDPESFASATLSEIENMFTLWTTTDTQGKFYTYENNTFQDRGNSYKQAHILEEISTGLRKSYKYNFPDIYYLPSASIGSVSIKAETFNSKNELFPKCAKSITLTTEAPICKEIQINHRFPITEGTQTKFVSKSISTNNNLFDENIVYEVEDGFGFFTTEKCEDLSDNTNNEIIEFSQTQQTSSNSSIFNSKKLQVSTLTMPSRTETLNLLNSKAVITPPTSLRIQQLEKGDIEIISRRDFLIEQIEKPIPETTLKTLQDKCNGTTKLIVSPETEVYFYALKPSAGRNVIKVSTENTSVNDCERSFAINPKPTTPEMPICTDLEIKTEEVVINGKAGLKITPTHSFDPRIFAGELETITTTWTTTDGLGTFYTLSNNQYTEQGQNYTQENELFRIVGRGNAYSFSPVYYTGESPLTKTVTIEIKTFDSQNRLFPPCVKTITLNPTPEIPVCLDLQTYDYITPETPQILTTLEASKAYILTNDTRYSSFVENAQTTYSSTEGAFLLVPVNLRSNLQPELIVSNLIIKNYASIGERLIASGFNKETANIANMQETLTVADGSFVLFITYDNAEEKTNALTVKASNRTEENCEKTYPLLRELICLDLVVIDWSIPTLPEALKSPLKENSVYELSSVVTMSKSVDTETKYTSTQGVFLAVPILESSSEIPTFIRDTLTINTYKKIANDLAESKLASTEPINLPRTITVNSSQTVFFITFVDAETTTNALKVEYHPEYTEDCEKIFALERRPVQETKECLDLSIIEPSGRWTYEDLESGNQRFEIEVRTSPASYEEDLEYIWTLRPSYSGTWTRGTTTTEKNNTLRNIDTDEEPRIIIQAIDKNTKEELPLCRASISFIDEEVKPEIKKYVYDKKNKSFRNIINIGGKADQEQAWLSRWLDKDFQFVNYLIEFTPNSAKSAEIYERYLVNGAIDGSINGKLDYLEMAILVEAKGNNNPYVIYISEGFDENRYLNERIGDERITNYRDNNLSIRNLERKYYCENASSSVVCIANDFDDIENDFKRGRKLVLSNLQNAERVYIILQTENNTTITDERCKELTTTEGCGEVFDNRVHFNGSRKELDRNFEINDLIYSGNDTAKVIVVCPYIIASQSGDVFFRDIVSTGIDISYCSEQTGGGVVIKPTEPTPTTPQTGAGDEDAIVYKLPTHDICKLSNTDISELDEYRNVLKNFSSSICEMEAEVSGIWKEENINSAIKRNINLLTRFGKITRDIEIQRVNELPLKGFGNTESGVFVVENGNLTIGDGINPYIIEKQEKVPAYQTYIVINGDINIKSNILYNDALANPSEPKSFPSSAFIAINGNINISNEVSEINGILMAVNEDEGTGQIKSLENRPTFDKLLTINGSLIGDVYEIFYNRRAIGDPLRDQGSITVRYDQRVLLNTPEGLNQLIDINQLRSAN